MDEDVSSENAVGASVSGGIDSFYTILKHLKRAEKRFCITHLVLSNIFGVYESEKESREKFNRLIQKNGAIAKELNLELVCIFTNIYEFNHISWHNYHSLKNCSMILALKKLFGVYYYASGYTISDFTIHPEIMDTALYDLFNMKTLSDRTLVFYSSGGEASRAVKTEYIADDPIVQKYLHICNIKEDNCSRCNKCQRTLIALWALGKLDDYKEVFDIDQFKKDKNKALIKILSRRNEFDCENLEFLRQKHIKIPFGIRLAGRVKRPVELLTLKLRKSTILRRIYYHFNLDVLRFGKEQAAYYRNEHIFKGQLR